MGHLRPNIECRLGSILVFQEIWTSITKKPYSFVIFKGGGGGWCPAPSGSAHVVPGAFYSFFFNHLTEEEEAG